MLSSRGQWLLISDVNLSIEITTYPLGQVVRKRNFQLDYITECQYTHVFRVIHYLPCVLKYAITSCIIGSSMQMRSKFIFSKTVGIDLLVPNKGYGCPAGSSTASLAHIRVSIKICVDSTKYQIP